MSSSSLREKSEDEARITTNPVAVKNTIQTQEVVQKSAMSEEQKQTSEQIATFDFQRTPAVVNQQLIKEIFKSKDPMAVKPNIRADWTYPHTNFHLDFFTMIITQYLLPNLKDKKLRYYLEVGSFKGGSITRMAELLKKHYADWQETSMVCVDPFTGDVNMWDWNNGKKFGHDFLDTGLDGRPRILDRFKANVLDKKVADMIVPIPSTGLVGMKLLARLHKQGRLSLLPEMIYLDSAHEKDETLLELKVAYDLLAPCGVLAGDDWGWQAVASDVREFVLTHAKLPPQEVSASAVMRIGQNQIKQPIQGLLLGPRSQWFFQKPPLEQGARCTLDGNAWW